MLIEREESSPFALLRRISLHWRPAAWVFAAVFTLTAAVALLLPSKYQAHLKILVKDVPADPASTSGMPSEVTEAQVNTEIQLLSSADVLRRVVRENKLADLAGTAKPQAKRDEAALRRLEKDLTVQVIRNSNVIEATYESRDPQRAAAVLSTLEREYLASHLHLEGASGSAQFFTQLAGRNSAQLAQAQADLAQFRRAHTIVALPEQKSLALQNIAHLQTRLEEEQASAQKSAGVARQLQQTMAALPPTVERERRSIPNQASVEQLSALLITLENKRAETVLRYRPEDRTVRELDTQIEQTRAALTKATQSRTEEIATGANPALQSAQTQYIQLTADHAGDQVQSAELARQLRDNQSRLASLDALSAAYDTLERKVSSLQDLGETYRKRTDDAHLQELLAGQGISNVAIVEQPFPPALPSSPKRGLILALGLVWSALLALATALGRDLWLDRIGSPFALEQATGMPLLAAVPLESHAHHNPYGPTFPALYLAMQRATPAPHRRAS